MRNRKQLTFIAAWMGGLSTWGCGASPDGGDPGDVGHEVAAVTWPNLIESDSIVAGMTSSTGNLYWTGSAKTAPVSALVFRASKGSTPGKETILAQLPDGTLMGQISWTLVGGEYYGFFTACESEAHCFIARVPLAGGDFTVVANSPLGLLTTTPVLTDGTNVYFSDYSLNLYSAPLTANDATPTQLTRGCNLDAQDATYLYCDQRDALILRIPKTGGTLVPVIGGWNTIQSVYIDQATDTVFWGELGGGVRSYSFSTGKQVVYQYKDGATQIEFVAFDGSRVVWTETDLPCNAGYPSCLDTSVKYWRADAVTTLVRYGFRDVVGFAVDPGGVYVADNNGIEKVAY